MGIWRMTTNIEPPGPGEVYVLGQNERLTLAIEILYHTGEGAALAAADSDMLMAAIKTHDADMDEQVRVLHKRVLDGSYRKEGTV